MEEEEEVNAARVFFFFFVVPDAAPGDVGGGGGSRSELVITWEVNHQSYALVCYSQRRQSAFLHPPARRWMCLL